jgi:UDP-hydrolysing UDP-N-acetyl-D-glucosamine 2-epimerase
MTGTRADYGHLYWVLRGIDNDDALTLQLVVTGAHLSPKWGHTVDQIEKDGFAIACRVPFTLDDDSPAAVAESMAQVTSGLARAFVELAPDVIVVLGDRYEVLAAAQAALVVGIPLAHLHGGETTEGAFDEAIRHSVTKMAHLHFVAAEDYAQRVRQLGEADDRIFNVGAPGLDHLEHTTLATRDELASHLDLALTSPLLVVTYHPETLDTDGGLGGLVAMLEALDDIDNATIVFTGVNADPGHDAISDRIAQFVAADTTHRCMVPSLGQARYLGLLRIANAVIGNSSSGMIEAPALRLPTVNIGDRQKGRLRAASVVDCSPDATDIRLAIERVLDPAFTSGLPAIVSVYGAGNASSQIVDILTTTRLDGIMKKHFVDRTFS